MLAAAVSAADLATAGHDASIAGIERSYADHEYTVTDLTRFYVERIGAIDQRGPALHAIIEINPDWASLAHGLDDDLKRGHPAMH